jgi:hypothetical protein
LIFDDALLPSSSLLTEIFIEFSFCPVVKLNQKVSNFFIYYSKENFDSLEKENFDSLERKIFTVWKGKFLEI